jgi:hypothetical protein
MAKAATAKVVPIRPHHRTQENIVVRVSEPRGKTKKKGHRAGRKSSEKTLMGLAIGGLVLGFLDKQGTTMQLPTIPVLGKAGTIAVVAHFLGKGKVGIVTDIRNAAAVVAAYEYGSTGKVAGDDDVSGRRSLAGHV